MTAVATALLTRKASLVGPAVGAAALLALLIARLVPADYAVGLGLRLAVAAVCVLLVPGFLVVRLLGRPTDPALIVVASLVWSLVAIFAALALTFALDRSLVFTAGVVAVLCLLAAGAGLVRAPPGRLPDRAALLTMLGLVAAGLIVGAIVWWAAPPIRDDALEHLARTRKLAELPQLESVRVSELFREGNLHPGYAFPLWHGALALVARLAGVDSAEVIRVVPAFLTPLAFVVTYAAGASLFRSRWAGLGVLGAQLAIFGLPLRGRPGLALLETISGPAHIALLVLVPALLALVFAFLEDGDRILLASIGAAAFALTVVHAPYVLFVALTLGGFAVARILLAPDTRAEAVRLGLAAGTVALSAGLFLVWLASVVTAATQFTPDPAEERRQLATYADQLDFFGDSFRFTPSALSAGGAVVVVGLFVLPFAALARRRRWAAFVLGSAVPILAVLLIPVVFTAFSDVATLSQARRLAAFLPLSFAVAGTAALLGRLRFAGVAVAVAIGLLFELLYPGEASFRHGPGGTDPLGGPVWVVWTAAVATGLAFLAAVALRRRPHREWGEGSVWAAIVALAFLVPVVALSAPDIELREHRPVLSVAFTNALRTEVEPGAVVFGREVVSYRAVAAAPVYVAAVEAGHAWDRPAERIADVRRFYLPGTSDAERRRLLAKYDATWLIVDKREPLPQAFLAPLERVYGGGRYSLYRVP